MKKRTQKSVNSQLADSAPNPGNVPDSPIEERKKLPVQTEFAFDENNLLNRRPTRLSLSILERAKQANTDSADENTGISVAHSPTKSGK